MILNNLPVTSREFKLMLNVDRFQERAAAAFWSLIEFIVVKKEGGKILEKQEEEEARITSYLDTPDAKLRQHGYILRLREESSEKFNLNLKYRSSDRYRSAARNISSPKAKAEDNKFEEDILPPYSSKYSNSTRVKFDADPAIKNAGQLVMLFPGLDSLAIPENTPVETLNGFKAHEVARKVGQFSFGGPKVKASLSFWYLLGDQGELPMIGEFSFDYEVSKTGPGELEQFHPATVEGVNRFFNSLQSHMGWLSPSLTTKSAFALDSI